MKLLLHICCAPCLIYPLEKLRKDGFEVSGFFYNPNIHPFSEYKARREALEEVGKKYAVEVSYPPYSPSEYFRAVNLKEESPQRCGICWFLRLKAAAKQAKEKGLDCFSTTLLVSPYQNQELLKKIGDDIAAEEGIRFYYEDFRPGFRKAHDEAKAKRVYCQKYCGCIYSELERYTKSKK